MAVGGTLQRLTDTVKALEKLSYEVVGVGKLDDTGGVTSEISVSVPVLDRIDLPSNVEVVPSDASVREDGSIVVDLTVTVPMTDPDDEGGRPTEKAYKDPERLQTVYDQYETFQEMRDALGVDVTPKTVRNHMVKHGIHDLPTDATSNGASKPTGTDASDGHTEVDVEREVSDATPDAAEPGEGTPDAAHPTVDDDGAKVSKLVADGAGLPDHVSLDSLKEIVQTSTTLYEVQQRMDLERNQVHQILRSLNLLDLVYGRISASDEQVTIEEIDARIRSSSLFDDLGS